MKKIEHLFLFVIVSLVAIGCGSDDEDTSFDDQLAKDVVVIDDYLAENGITADVHSSGIRFVRNEVGDGESPSLGDDVAVKYEAFLLNETLLGFDTIGFTLNLSNQIIEAWRLMIPEMRERGKLTFYTPSGYAFGRNGNTSIPPNSVLIYEIELLAKIDDAEEQQIVDEDIIDEYLEEKGIEVEIDASGIRYEVLEEGTGASPNIDDNVSVVYEGAFLNGVVFDESSAEFSLENLIEAWKIMIPQMKEGGKLRIFAPSRYCYGPGGTPGIPPNTVLVFEIELIEVQ